MWVKLLHLFCIVLGDGAGASLRNTEKQEEKERERELCLWRCASHKLAARRHIVCHTQCGSGTERKPAQPPQQGDTTQHTPHTPPLHPATEGRGAATARILSVADQLKAARGLVIIAGVLEGDAIGSLDQITTATEVIKKRLAELRTRGFVKVGGLQDLPRGLHLHDAGGWGLGELSPNTVVVQWPDDWRIKDTVAG